MVTSGGDEAAAATVEQVRFLHGIVGGHLQVKAAGVFRSWLTSPTAVAAGADRISTSFEPPSSPPRHPRLSSSGTRLQRSRADVGAAAR